MYLCLCACSCEAAQVFLAGAQMPTGGVYTVWTNSTRVEQLTAAQQIVVAMPSDYWYLDHPVRGRWWRRRVVVPLLLMLMLYGLQIKTLLVRL